MTLLNRSLIVSLLLAGAGLAVAAPTKVFKPDKLVNPEAFYPEGPQLVPEGLLVAEMSKDRVVLITADSVKPVWGRQGCGPTSIKHIPSGGFWVLCHLGHHVVRLDESFKTLQSITQTTSGRRVSHPNDASVDHKGNLYLSSSGDFSMSAPAEGRVVFIDVTSNVASDLASGLKYSNGVLVQEKLGRVLVSEHLKRRVMSFPLLAPGKLGTPSVFFDFKLAPLVADAYELSGADGLAAFADGDICVADYGNGRIIVVSGKGDYLTQIQVDLRYVTNMAIAPDQKSLYVTMTRDNSSGELDGVVQKFLVK